MSSEEDASTPMEEEVAPAAAAAADDSDNSDSPDDNFDPSKPTAAASDGDDDDDDSDGDFDPSKPDPTESGDDAGEADEAEEDSDDDVLDVPQEQKKKNKRKMPPISDDEDEDEDEDEDVDVRPKRSGFLDDEAEADDDDDEEDDDDGSAVEDLIDDTEIVQHKKKKRKTRIDDDEKELDKDDLDLLVENLGQDAKVLKKKDYKRLNIRRDDDDEEAEDAAEAAGPASLAFTDDVPMVAAAAPAYRTDGLDDESDEDNWIVDDKETEAERKKRKAAKKKSRAKMTEQEKEAAEIFGTSVLRMLGDDKDSDRYSEEEDDIEARELRKVQKIRDTYAPDEIERHFLTSADDEIRQTDLPERVQRQFGDFRFRYLPSPDGKECREEAEWIFERVYAGGDRISAVADRILVRVLEGRSRRDMLGPMSEVVRLLRWEVSKRLADDDGGLRDEVDCSGPREVPFIAQYRKELVGFPDILNMHDLWLIKEWDERWHNLQARKAELQSLLRRTWWLQDRLAANVTQFARDTPMSHEMSEDLQAEECCRLVRGAKEVRANNKPYFEWLLAGGGDHGAGHRRLQQLDGAADEVSTVESSDSALDSGASMAIENDPSSVSEAPAGDPMTISEVVHASADGRAPVGLGSFQPETMPPPPPPPAAAPAPAAKSSAGSILTSRAMIQPTDTAFESDRPLWTPELAVKRRISQADIDRVSAAATEDELDVAHEHLLLHVEDDFALLQTYESDLLNWCNATLQDFGANVKNFHRSWWDGQALCMLVKACLSLKVMNSEADVDDRVDIQEGEPVANLNEAKTRAHEDLGIDFDFDPVGLVCCKNGHCGPREKLIKEIDDDSSKKKEFLCLSCRPDDLTVIRAVSLLRECHESFSEPETRQFGKDAKRMKSRKYRQYDYARRGGLLRMIDAFGLTPEEFAANLQMSFMQYEPREQKDIPIVVASQFLSNTIKTSDDALRVSLSCMAAQLARDPQVYAIMKDKFLARATITVRPTERGRKDIEDWHPYARYKYITHKPLRALQDTDYLWIKKGEDEGQLTSEIKALYDDALATKLRMDGDTIMWDQLERCFVPDFTSTDAGGAWNEVRKDVVHQAVTELLYPRIEKEVRTSLLREGQATVLAKAANHLRSKISRAPFESDRVGVDESIGIQVIAIIPGDSRGREQMPTYAVLLGTGGDMIDFLRLDWFMTSENTRSALQKEKRTQDWDDFAEFLHRNHPDAIVVGAFDISSQRVHRDICGFLQTMAEAAERGEEDHLPKITVEYGEMQLARIYASSARSLEEFPDHDPRVRQAVSLGRRFQNSEREFAGAFNQDNEILSIPWHPLQGMVKEDELLATLAQEVITAVNRSGVDFNTCMSHPSSAATLPFVSGLGPRKAAELLKQVSLAKREEGGVAKISSREHLMLYKDAIGSAVLWISLGILYIQSDEHGGNDLDRTRVHPESYRYAMKIAKDARGELPTQVQGEDDDGGLEAVQSIMEDPGDALDNIDLRVFAHELAKQGQGNKLQTLFDILRELQNPGKDTRLEYVSLNSVQLFVELTGETVQTLAGPTGVALRRDVHPALADLGYDPHEVFAHGPGANELFFCNHIEEMPSLVQNQLVPCEVSRLAYKEHDEGPRSVGFSAKLLDSPIVGFVPIQDLSDERTEDAADRVEVGMIIQARVMSFNIERFSVKLACKSSVLKGSELSYIEWGWDPDYDMVAHLADIEDMASKKAKAQRYSRRRIDHPMYHHVGFPDAVKMLKDQPAGEVIIRPSSKGLNNITVTYKVTGSSIAHINVCEEDKRARDELSLGKKLTIGKEEFESLDELLATYVNPLTDFAKTVCNHKYFREAVGRAESEDQLRKEKDANPHRNPYCMWYDDEKGTFRISYMPGRSVKCERIVVGPEGFKFRNKRFQTIEKLISWFKVHFADALPRQKPSFESHMGGASRVHQPSRLAYSSGPPPGPRAHAPAPMSFGGPPIPPPAGARGYHPGPPQMPPGMAAGMQYGGRQPPGLPPHMHQRF